MTSVEKSDPNELLGSTRDRLLDAAEVLFAERGYDAVSTRAITDRAGARLNLLSYHFGSKQNLFEAVIDRRLNLINDRRLLLMEDLSKRPSQMSVGDVLSAFMFPYFDLASHGDPGWLSYARLVAQTSQSEKQSSVLDEHMRSMSDLYLAALAKALPNASTETLKTGYHYAVILMLAAFSGIGRIEGLIEGHLSEADLTQACRPLLIYAEAGLLALVAADELEGAI